LFPGLYGVGFSRGYETAADSLRCRRATPETAVMLFGGMARPQGVVGYGLAGPGETLGSPWLTHMGQVTLHIMCQQMKIN
jgi:hypothetical protein